MPAFGAKKSKWKKAGFLVRNVVSTRDVAKTGLEVLDGRGLPVKIVDQKSGDELNGKNEDMLFEVKEGDNGWYETLQQNV